jgi:hypothetical protein
MYDIYQQDEGLSVDVPNHPLFVVFKHMHTN